MQEIPNSNGNYNPMKNGDMNLFNPDKARKLTKYTDKFMCNLSDNTYKIKFLLFKVRDLESNQVLFEVASDTNDEETEQTTETVEDDEKRIIKYHLGPEFLDLTSLGSTLRFSVGENQVKNFLMIEKHYFKNKLMKSFEFKFDYCIPHSTNEWESMYTIPELTDQEKEEMIAAPWETKSDSFYFVGEKLVMHHKAIYNYSNFE
jgi:hypothetical protein